MIDMKQRVEDEGQEPVSGKKPGKGGRDRRKVG